MWLKIEKYSDLLETNESKNNQYFHLSMNEMCLKICIPSGYESGVKQTFIQS